MAQPGTEISSSTGRIVWGHPMKLTQRQDNNEQPIFNQDGSPAMGIAFGLAIPKNDFLAREWPAMAGEAGKGFPGGVPGNFSWKMKDGDTDKDRNGNLLSTKEGYAGCFILTITSNTGFPVSTYKWNAQAGRYDQLSENDIKTGDFVSVALRFIVNIPTKSTHTPSLYVNPQAVELVGYGKALAAGGVDPMKAFGGQQRQLPPGASAAPVSSAPEGVGMPVGQPAPAQQPMQPQPGYPAQQPMQPQPGYPAQQPMQPQPGYPAQQPMQPQPGYPAQQPMQPMQPQPGYPAQQPMQPMQPQPGYPAPATDFVQPMPGMMPPR